MFLCCILFVFSVYSWCFAMPAPPDRFLSAAHSWIERAGSIPGGGYARFAVMPAKCDFECWTTDCSVLLNNFTFHTIQFKICRFTWRRVH